ncbi:three-helix bundle dimerization domain-containing protein [Microbacterium sp. CJ88]|uniref:arsenate reductase/protein-tyrosine-phosphatase family protein n=1 Tax=Microbacterium sp. CJ88 TaxID=3445672 RepID=UPI003F65F661
MASDSAPKPLDLASAKERAAQVAALADPRRLRLMSILVTDPAGSYTAELLASAAGQPLDELWAHLPVLMDAGLLTCEPSATDPIYRPTADTWMRFGRVLAPTLHANVVLASGGLGPAALPPVIQKIVDRLSYRFSTNFSRETVQKYVTDSYELLRERAKVTRHLPSLTSRFATDRLSALATAHGFTLSGTPEVLFVCVQNAGRSQIAAAILRQLAGDRVHVRTAGSQPVQAVDASVIELLDEVGVPLGEEFPKPLTEEVVQGSDVIVTMGCGDACPVYPGKRYFDWAVDDPIGKPTAEARLIRDDIHSRVEGLLQSIGLDSFGDATSE